MNRKIDISFGRKRISSDTEKEENGRGKNSLAASVVMIVGTAVLLLFFFFASFGKNTEPIEYAENDVFNGEGIVSVFSQIVSPDGRTVDNSEEVFQDEGSTAVEVQNTKWNLWQYICDSLAELFGMA